MTQNVQRSSMVQNMMLQQQQRVMQAAQPTAGYKFTPNMRNPPAQQPQMYQHQAEPVSVNSH